MLTRLLLTALLLSRLAAADPCQQLLSAIQQRLELSRQIAAYKWIHHLPIEDPVREQALLDTLQDEGARDFMRCQIEASKQLQNELFEQFASRPPIDPAPDLRQLRSQLDQLTRQLTDGLTHLPCPGWKQEARALWGTDPPPWVETALEPFRSAVP